jgi:hypothetical protein
MKKWRDLLLVIYKKEALNFKTHFLVFPKKIYSKKREA